LCQKISEHNEHEMRSHSLIWLITHDPWTTIYSGMSIDCIEQVKERVIMNKGTLIIHPSLSDRFLLASNAKQGIIVKADNL